SVRVLRPGRIGRIHDIGSGHDALDVVEARRLHHRADAGRDIVDVVHRLPADVGRLAHRLGGELGRGDVEEDVGAARLELDDLRIDRGICDLEGDVLGDAADLLAKTLLETLPVVLAVVV